MTITNNNPALLLSELMEFLRDTFHEPTHFFCGWSGGVDSTCMLFLMREFVHSFPEHQLTAVHINHNIHPQSLMWQHHCRDLAERYEINFCAHDVTVNHNKGTECSARDARWSVFNSLTSHLPRCIVLGHHAEDQVETFLLNLLRGAGLSGLRSMRRLIQRSELKLLRPLLSYRKSQCLDYVNSHGLPTIQDSSNFDSEYARNYLRLDVMPMLMKRWPNSVENVNYSISALQSDWDMLSNYTLDRLRQISRRRFGLFCIDRNAFNDLNRTERHLFIRVYLSQRQWYLPARGQLDELLDQIQAAKTGRECAFSTQQFSLRVYRNEIYIFPAGYFTCPPDDIASLESPLSSYTFQCPNDCRLDLLGAEIDAKTCQLLFNRKSIMQIMTPRRLKNHYQALGVPPFLRPVVPMLLLGGVPVGVTVFNVKD